MPRNLRRSRMASCARKTSHPTQAAALTAAARQQQAGATRLAVYRCPRCAGWHVGHWPQPRHHR